MPHPSPSHAPARRGPRIVAAITAGLLVVFTASFAVGTALGFTDPVTVEAALRGQSGVLGASAVVALLVGDLFLPVPASVVMVVSGALFGTVGGTILNTAGALGGALLGYGLCRRLGSGAFARLVGEELPDVQARFDARAPWVVLLSRAVPMATETVSCLAGLVGMPLPLFTGLSLLGTLPVAFVYALAGAQLGGGDPGGALALAFGLPVVAWAALRWATPSVAATRS